MDDREGDDEGGKGDGGRGYLDDDDEGHDGTFPKGGGRRWSSSGGEGTQQSNINPTSMTRNLVSLTVRATTKAARTMGAGATWTTAMRDDGPPPAARVHNNQILSRHQWQGTWCR